jgi:hypothetical protein
MSTKADFTYTGKFDLKEVVTELKRAEATRDSQDRATVYKRMIEEALGMTFPQVEMKVAEIIERSEKINDLFKALAIVDDFPPSILNEEDFNRLWRSLYDIYELVRCERSQRMMDAAAKVTGPIDIEQPMPNDPARIYSFHYKANSDTVEIRCNGVPVACTDINIYETHKHPSWPSVKPKPKFTAETFKVPLNITLPMPIDPARIYTVKYDRGDEFVDIYCNGNPVASPSAEFYMKNRHASWPAIIKPPDMREESNPEGVVEWRAGRAKEYCGRKLFSNTTFTWEVKKSPLDESKYMITHEDLGIRATHATRDGVVRELQSQLISHFDRLRTSVDHELSGEDRRLKKFYFDHIYEAHPDPLMPMPEEFKNRLGFHWLDAPRAVEVWLDGEYYMTITEGDFKHVHSSWPISSFKNLAHPMTEPMITQPTPRKFRHRITLRYEPLRSMVVIDWGLPGVTREVLYKDYLSSADPTWPKIDILKPDKVIRLL